MAATKKSMAPKRKGKKQLALVHFEVEGYEGEFVAPKIGSVMGRPRVTMGLREGDFSHLHELLVEHDEGTAEAFSDMDDEDQKAFFKAWGDASGVDSGKSSESSV